jgi:selenocysteine-specific elongation factor
VARRDRFILRIPSPSTTIGGGEVVDIQPRYHRRFQPAILSRLATLEYGAPEELVLATLDRRTRSAGTPTQFIAPASNAPKTNTPQSNTFTKGKGLIGYELVDIVKQSNLAKDVTLETLETLLSEGRVRRVGTLWFAQPVWEALVEETIRLLGEQHRQYPLRSGLPKEEWRARLNLSPKMAGEIFAAIQAEGVASEAVITTTGSFIRLSNFEPRFNSAQQQKVAQLLQRFRENPYTPPGRADVEAMVGTEVLGALIEQGQIVKIGDAVLFLRETYDEAIATLIQYLREHGKMTVAEARDVLGATRKYILPLLEHMDALKITRRMGDERVPGTMVL